MFQNATMKFINEITVALKFLKQRPGNVIIDVNHEPLRMKMHNLGQWLKTNRN